MVLYRFKEWQDGTGTPIGTNPELPIYVAEDMTITAVYELVPHYNLIITATAGGTTSPVLGSYEIVEGETQQVTALPDSDYRFVHWELDGEIKPENPINVTMDKNYSLHAIFEYVGPGTATITGIIRDRDTGNPIGGVSVTCDGYADITAIDGSYALTAIPAASYTLTVTKEGYEPQTYPIDMSAGGDFTKDFDLTPKEVEKPPETIFDQVWNRFEEFSKNAGLPVPPKPPQPPPLPLE